MGRRKATRPAAYVPPTHGPGFGCCPDLERAGSVFEQAGRSNAAETVGGDRIDTREGVEIERNSVACAIDDACGRHWVEYRDGLDGPLSDEMAHRLHTHFSAWYRWVLAELAKS